MKKELVINDDYQVVDIDSIYQDPENIKKHDRKDIEEKKESLLSFGFTRPIIANTTTKIIAAGNGIHIAAKELGYKVVPVIFKTMERAEAKALAISDNRLSENGKYDLTLFNEAIKEINVWNPNIEWKGLGFDGTEIKLLLESINSDFSSNNDSNDDHGSGLGDTQLDEDDTPAKAIKTTKGQRTIIDLAIKSLREMENDAKMTEGRCLELICADFLNSLGTEDESNTNK